MSELRRLAELIGRRNEIEVQITKIIERPAQIGHLGEFVASRVFKIELARSASQRGSDGTFSSGTLSGRSVNIKWYSMDEGILALDQESVPDYYLVLAGPRHLPVSSRGQTRPWLISSVYLFKGPELIKSLREGGVKINVATGVRKKLWEAAEIYPEQRSSEFVLSRELAYRLYTICDRKKRASEALSYNALVQSWPEITRLARESGRPHAQQAGLFGQE